jgi:hypothetical protein
MALAEDSRDNVFAIKAKITDACSGGVTSSGDTVLISGRRGSGFSLDDSRVPGQETWGPSTKLGCDSVLCPRNARARLLDATLAHTLPVRGGRAARNSLRYA